MPVVRRDRSVSHAVYLYTLVTPSLSDGMTVLEIGPNRAFGHAIFERFPVTYLCSDLSDRRASVNTVSVSVQFSNSLEAQAV